MRIAIDAAKNAALKGEVPIGALIYDPSSEDSVSICANSSISAHDSTAHAEILAIREAGRKLNNYRLSGLWLYVTLEPCAMCAGAISHARISRLIFGASDIKGGAVLHGPRFFDQATCHHKPEISHGVLAQECGDMLRSFFKERRLKGRNNDD